MLSKIKFYHKYINGNLPPAFANLSFHSVSSRHDHNTRQKNNLLLAKPKHNFACASVSYSIPKLINTLPEPISSKFSTHSIKGLCLYIKTITLRSYEELCNLVGCYACAKEKTLQQHSLSSVSVT